MRCRRRAGARSRGAAISFVCSRRPVPAGRARSPEAIPKRPREYARLLHFDSLTHSPASLRFLVAEFGADRVAMGSDYPFDMGSPDPVAPVAEAGLAASAQALIEGDTAARFLGL